MIDALLRLFEDRTDCCRFYQTITSQCENDLDVDNTQQDQNQDNLSIDVLSVREPTEGLNRSQSAAVHSCNGPLSLIWGPPGLPLSLPQKLANYHLFDNEIGTGKTTVVVQILRLILQDPTSDLKILMSASTHNGTFCLLRSLLKLLTILNQPWTMFWNALLS